MPAIRGIHHLTSLTADMDRLIGFYRRVFDAPVVLDLEEEGLRHVFIELGPSCYLHPFEVPGVEVPQGEIPMFARGRLDHFGLNAASEEEFQTLRRRIVEQGAGDGLVADMGTYLSVSFTDPDGAGHEVMWTKPGVPVEAVLPRPEWTTEAWTG